MKESRKARVEAGDWEAGGWLEAGRLGGWNLEAGKHLGGIWEASGVSGGHGKPSGIKERKSCTPLN